ncbi:MAG: hypothetical protein JJ971_11730 [Balneolaceae bacterium]|nr:hypothetical protein [Balneolaceae bacterium]MBO6547480.1 hypothetical protein [Balneolaceae bacterium]MBO6647573.1 hypothetical protein [Balneolaceae bacterium]
MKKLLLYSSVSVLTGLFLLNCDSTTNPSNSFTDGPEVTELTITPSDVNFVPADGFKDTTLTISVLSTIENVTEATTLGYVLRDKNTQLLISEGELAAASETDVYGIDLSLETTTTSFEELITEVYAYNPNGNGNFFQAAISISGFSNNPPEILEANNPDTLIRPESGEIIARFTSKVRDLDGQSSIDQVLIRVINKASGEVSGSPFQMVDNGTSGDITANDSTFTWALPVTATEDNPNRDFDIEYFAIDLGGLMSDTVRTTFSIRE